MKWLTTNETVAAYFSVEPPMNMDALVYEFWDGLLKALQQYAITMVLVIDGARNPAKTATNTDRETQRVLAHSRLINFIEQNDTNNVNEAYKYLKQCTYVREDIVLATVNWARDRKVRFLCSPMESDWQLVSLELSGITCASMTEDSDLIVLGSQMMLCKADFINGKAVMLKPSEQWRNWVQSMSTMHTDWTHDDFISYCVFVGCDYISRPKNMGERTIMQFMPYWISASWRKRINIVKYIEKKGAFPTSAEVGAIDAIASSMASCVSRYPNYSLNFWKAYFIFKYPPIFKVTAGNNNEWVDVSLSILRAEDAAQDAEVREATIGNYIQLFLGLQSIERDLHSAYANMQGNCWIRTKTAIIPCMWYFINLHTSNTHK